MEYSSLDTSSSASLLIIQNGECSQVVQMRYPILLKCVQNRVMARSKRIRRLAPIFFAWLFFAVHPVEAWCQQGSQNSDSSSPSANSQKSAAQNQSSSGQSSGKTAASPSKSDRSKNPSDDNAFPMQQSEAAAKSGSQQSGSSSAASKSSTAKSAKASPAQDNPFPEDQSAAAAKQNGSQGGGQSSNTSQNKSADPSGYSSSDAHLPPPDLGLGKSAPTSKKMDSFTRDQTQDGRIHDDLNVADFYMKNGNYRGAYMRYEDALKFDPQNDTALYMIGEAMCKQNMTSDAMAQFKRYTKTNPQGKYARKAEKMMVHPGKCMHNF